MTHYEQSAIRAAMLGLLKAQSPHAVRCVVLTEPSGARRMEMRRVVDGSPLLACVPYSPVLLAAFLAENVAVEYRPCLRLPPLVAP